MNRGSDEVKRLLTIFEKRIDENDIDGYRSYLGMCMYGIRSIPNCQESRKLILKFASLLHKTTTPLSEKELSFILYGLKIKVVVKK